MFRTLIWHLFGACAFSARMVVISAGCIALTAFVTGWEDLDWRFRVVASLFCAAYLFAASIEFLAGLMAKSDKKEGES